MNQFCVLSKERSFKDVAYRPGAYQLLAKTVAKFPARKRSPFKAPEPDQEPAQKNLFEPPQSQPAIETAPVEPTPVVVETPVIKPEVTPQPAPDLVNPTSPFAEGAQPKGPGPVRRAWGFMTGFGRGLVTKAFARKWHPARAASVQPELALDKVKVLRNDLNEDDLEVVLVNRKVGTCEKPLARLSKVEMTSEAWIKLTAPFRKKDGACAIDPKAESKEAPELSARA